MNIKFFKAKSKSRKAFTMVEIILAIFVLEIGLLGVAGFYAYSFQITKIARNQTLAVNLAQGFLEEEFALDFDDLAVIDGGKITLDPPFSNFQKEIDVAWLGPDLVASYEQTDPNSHMKKITVTIYWIYQSAEKNFQITTIKAEH